MSTEFQSETIILGNTNDFYELASAYSGVIPHSGYKDLWKKIEAVRFTPSSPTEKIIARVSGKSRGAWIAYVARQVCEMANIKGIEFLYCSRDISADWNFQDEGFFIEEHAYLLTESKIAAAISAIDQFFSWSKEHIDKLSAFEPIAYCVGKEELEESIVGAVVASNPVSGWDGDEPQSLYSFLASVRDVLKNAIIYRKDVLHTAMVAC